MQSCSNTSCSEKDISFYFWLLDKMTVLTVEATRYAKREKNNIRTLGKYTRLIRNYTKLNTVNGR